MSNRIRHDTAGIGWSAAAEVVRAAIAEADSRGILVNVAVVDRAGNLMSFLRMPGAFLHSTALAVDKAYTAASFGFPTDQWPAMLAEDKALWSGLASRPRLVVLGGGFPILIDDICVGGIGVSGGSEAEDCACARAGLAMLETLV